MIYKKLLVIIFVSGLLRADFEFRMRYPTSSVIKNEYATPGLKAYQAGDILRTDIHKDKISFIVKDVAKKKEIYFLIIKPTDISHVLKKVSEKEIQNTIEYRVVLPKRPYKLYKISSLETGLHITETFLTLNQPIPDTAVILFYNPTYVKDFVLSEEDNIPTIFLSNNIIEMAGGVDQLFYEELRYLFDTLHIDLFYKKDQYRIVLGNSCYKQIIGL